MRRNPLLYSDSSEIENEPQTLIATPQESQRESSFLFYFIILANSLLVLFVLGFIWFLFFKSPDIQLKELSNRYLGTSLQIDQPTVPKVVTPTITPEVVISPSQQEKDEVQQAQLKQMREKEELAAERTRLETLRAELEAEKRKANEAQTAIKSMEALEITPTPEAEPETPAISTPQNTTSSANQSNVTLELEGSVIKAITPVATDTADSKQEEPAVVPNAAAEPGVSNSTSSQVDLIMEALRNQQQENAATEN